MMQRAVDRHPENGRIWWRHGRMLRYNQSIDMSLDALQRAVTAPSVRNNAQFDLACVFQALGETGKSRKIFETLANDTDTGLLGMSAQAKLVALDDPCKIRRPPGGSLSMSNPDSTNQFSNPAGMRPGTITSR